MIFFRWGYVKGSKTKKSIFNGLCYGGHRKFLPIEHYLRSLGQSCNCCPEGYYDADNKGGVIIESYMDITDPREVSVRTIQRRNGNNWLTPCEGDEFYKSAVREFYKSHQHFVYYYSERYDTMEFKPFLYYHHADYRKQVEFKRVSNSDYKRDGKLAMESDTVVHGVKSLWPFAALDYVDISRCICYDPFHVLLNFVRNLFELLLGKREITTMVRKFCMNTNSHPELWEFLYHEDISSESNSESKMPISNKKRKKKSSNEEKYPPIWSLKKSQYENIERIYFNSVLVAVGVSDRMRLKGCFSNFGLRKSMERIAILQDAMDFICHSISNYLDYPSIYLLYFSRMSDMVSQLLAPIICEDNLKMLIDKVLENICIHEGLFPAFESKFTLHELLDLVHFIRVSGPLRCWWTFHAERGISKVKKKVRKGGRKYYLSAVKNEIELEYVKAQSCYKNHGNAFTDFKAYNIDEKGNVIFTDFKTAIDTRTFKKVTLTQYEHEELLEFIMNETLNKYDNITESMQKSPLLRLNYVFRYYTNKHLESNGERVRFTAHQFVHFISFLSRANMDDFEIYDSDFIDEEIILTEDAANVFHKSNGRYIIKSDFLLAKYYNSVCSKLKFYSKGLVYGRKYKGRGDSFRELESANDGKPTNGANDLSSNYHQRSIYTTCCFVKNVDKKETMYFANINGFVILKITKEPFFNGKEVAMITARTLKPVISYSKQDKNTKRYTDHYGNLFAVNMKEIEHSIVFSLMHNIYPGPVCIVPYEDDSAKEPIPVNDFESTKCTHMLAFQSERNRNCVLEDLTLRKKFHCYYK